jgi:acetylornithine/N-succinyldiaminopimelate aminotransferase
MAESKNETVASRGSAVLLGNYRPQPVAIVGGDGAVAIDADGNSYIDFVSGIAVSSLGHSHPALVAAIREQAGRVLHTANVVWNEPAVSLAEKLVAKSFAERVYFCNSGTEAIEASLKLARRYFYERKEGRFEFISFEKSFHGRTLGAVSVTGQEKYKEGFEPLLPGVKTVPYGDISAVEAALTERTAAVIVENIQGEGGLRVPPPGFLRELREVTRRHGCLLILDEVQSGVGRCGTLWGYEGEGMTPDIMAIAKGIGGGLPLGAMLTTDAIGAAMTFGSHGSTYGGNPLACAAGNVVLDVVSDPAFLARVRVLGEHLMMRLQTMVRTHRKIAVEARGRGLWCGLELSVDAAKLPRAGLPRGLLLNVIGGKVVRIAPPLIIDQRTLDRGLDVLDAMLGDLADEVARSER